MLGAAEDIVRRGGQRGIGCTLVTQRSAVLNKNVLTQAQMLIVLRTIAPQDLAAMNAWIDVHGEAEQRKILMESLPSLPVGDAWFWSPGWPTAEGIFNRVHVLPIETFDSGASPKPGERRIVPRNLADVDLEALKGKMAATLEKAKADDPRALRAQIASLNKELGQRPSVEPKRERPAKVERVEVAVLKDAQIGRLEAVLAKMQKEAERNGSAMALLWGSLNELATALVAALDSVKRSEPIKEVGVNGNAISRAANVRPDETARPQEPSQDADITGPEQRILDAIAWANSIGIERPNNSILAFLAGYTNPRSTGYTNPRGALAQRGLVSYPIPNTVALTEAGAARAAQVLNPGDENELQQRVLERLTGPQRRILKILIEAHGNPVANEVLAEQAGYSNARSTGYTNPRGELRSYGLIEYVPEGVRASDLLFL